MNRIIPLAVCSMMLLAVLPVAGAYAEQQDPSYKYLAWLPSQSMIDHLSTASQNELLRMQLQANNDNIQCQQSGNASFVRCLEPSMNSIYAGYFLAIKTNNTQLGMTNDLTRLTYLYGWCLEEHEQDSASCNTIFVLFTEVDRLLNP